MVENTNFLEYNNSLEYTCMKSIFQYLPKDKKFTILHNLLDEEDRADFYKYMLKDF